MKDIIVHVLEIVAKTQVEDVVRVVDELLEHFLDTVIPVAAEITESLVILYSGFQIRCISSSFQFCFSSVKSVPANHQRPR